MFDLAALPGNTHLANPPAKAPRLDLYVPSTRRCASS